MLITDLEFDNVVRRDKACTYINNFFDSLSGKDSFGFIGLGDKSQNLEIPLEPKKRNPHVKKLILESISESEPSSILKDNKFSESKLQEALDKAMTWQQEIEDSTIRINNYTYFSPHKWIVCLIGSDTHNIGKFIED